MSISDEISLPETRPEDFRVCGVCGFPDGAVDEVCSECGCDLDEWECACEVCASQD